MSFIISTPPRKHYCHPGWIEKNGHLVNVGAFYPSGTVLGCSCGKTYVAHYDTRPNRGYISLAAEWRLESRIKRWLRERKASKVPFKDLPEWEPPFTPLILDKPEVDEF